MRTVIVERGNVLKRSGLSSRSWVGTETGLEERLQSALAHTVANKVEAAYHRTDLLEKRRTLMEAWAKHVFSG